MHHDHSKEWRDLTSNRALPVTQANVHLRYEAHEFLAQTNEFCFNFVHAVVGSVRHIGVDQDIQNFAICVIDMIADEKPKLVSYIARLALAKSFLSYRFYASFR